MRWYDSVINTGTMMKNTFGKIVRKPQAISVLMDEMDVQIEFDRLEHEDFVQERVRKIARAEARERDLEYEKEASIG